MNHIHTGTLVIPHFFRTILFNIKMFSISSAGRKGLKSNFLRSVVDEKATISTEIVSKDYSR